MTFVPLPDISTLAAEIRTDRAALRDELAATIPSTGALDRARLRAIARAHRAALHRDEGARDTAEYLAGLFQISQWKARRWIEAAQALERLPRIAAALEAGALSLDKTVELCRFATPDTEEGLVAWARHVTMGSVRKRAEIESKRELAEVQEVRAARRLEFTWSDDRLEFEGLLPKEEGARFVEAVDNLAHELPSVPDDTDPSSIDAAVGATLDQRRADALVLLAAGGSDGAGPATMLVLHAPIEVLSGDDGGCRVEGGPVLHPETARRLSCDSRLQMILEDEHRKPIGIGRKSQITPPWLRRLVFERDGHTCTFPGCEMKRFLHPHHVQHWSRQGPTDLDNLITVCTFHHTLVHEGRWSVILDNGRPMWFRPGGRVHDPGAAPPAHAPPAEQEPPRLAVAAGYSPLFEMIQLMDPTWKPDPAVSRKRAARIRARLKQRRLPEWARAQIDEFAHG